MKANQVWSALFGLALVFMASALMAVGNGKGEAAERIPQQGGLTASRAASTAKTGGTTTQQSGETKSDNTGGAASGGGHHDLTVGGKPPPFDGKADFGHSRHNSAINMDVKDSLFPGRTQAATGAATQQNDKIIFATGGHGFKNKTANKPTAASGDHREGGDPSSSHK